MQLHNNAWENTFENEMTQVLEIHYTGLKETQSHQHEINGETSLWLCFPI